jgi:hypothetical protein
MQSAVTPQDAKYYAKAYYPGSDARCIYHGDNPQELKTKVEATRKAGKVTRIEVYQNGKRGYVWERPVTKAFIDGKVVDIPQGKTIQDVVNEMKSTR